MCGVTVAEFGQWRKELMVHLLRSHKQDPLSPSMAAINQRLLAGQAAPHYCWCW